jgi:DNA sulfur modification protein DndB
METKQLGLPCLRGVIGDWVYYSTIIPFAEVHRIDNNHQIKEDKALDNWLQRELSNRVESIKEYLLKEEQRFFNSVVVGVYGEIPDWYSLDITGLSHKNDKVFASRQITRVF